MRALSNGILVCLVGLGIACGGEGKLTRCDDDDQCTSNNKCSKKVDGERGVCIPRDTDECLYSCGKGEVRTGAQCQCVSKYQVSVAVQSGGQNVTQIGATGPAKVVVTVTKGAASVTSLASVALTPASGTPTIAHPSDTVDTYTFNYTVATGTESDVEFEATAGSGDDARTGSTTVSIDTKPPVVTVTPDNTSFGGGATITFKVKVADAHPPTGALQATFAGSSAPLPLTYSSGLSAAGYSIYTGSLSPTELGTRSLPCGFTVNVTAGDTLSTGASDTTHQASGAASMGITCEASQVCAQDTAYLCNEAYEIGLAGVANGDLLKTRADRNVVVTVTRGSSTMTDTPTLSTSASPVTGPVPSGSGLTSIYTYTYAPPVTEGNFTFQASVGSGAYQKSTPVVTVGVDTQAPLMTTTGVGSRYLRTDPVTFSVTVVDAHLPTNNAITVQLYDGVNVIATLTPSPTASNAVSRTYSNLTFNLRQLPFLAFEKTLTIGVGPVTDTADNVSGALTSSFVETRQRWVTQTENGVTDMTTPAIDSSGNLYSGRSTSGTKVVKINRTSGLLDSNFAPPSGNDATSLGSAVTSAPVVGSAGVWVGTTLGKIALLNSTTGAVLTNCSGNAACSCNTNPTGTNINASLAVVPNGGGAGVDTVYAGSANGKVYQLTNNGDFSNKCNNPIVLNSGSQTAISAPPLISGSNVYVADQTALYRIGGGGAGLSKLADTGAVVGALALDGTSIWAAVVVAATPARNNRNLISIALSDGTVTTRLPTAGWIYAVGQTPIVASGGDVIIGVIPGDENGNVTGAPSLGRLNSTNSNWNNPSLDGWSNGALALTNNGSKNFLVPTGNGTVRQLDDNGDVVWSGMITPSTNNIGSMLHEANIFTENGVSTAYFGSNDGHVYAVIVDGALDASAPWPRVGQNPQNTSYKN